MLKDVAKLNVKGRIFNENTVLTLFLDEENRQTNGVILYGRNGTGKSTISSAFAKARGESVEDIEIAEFLDKDGKVIALDLNDRERIFVFNEDFIDKKVKFVDKGGMETIVMLGDLGDIDDQIKHKNEALEKAVEEEEKQAEICKKYSFDGNENPEKLKAKRKDALKNDGCWQERAKKCIELPKNATDRVVEDCLATIPSAPYATIVTQFENKLREYHAAKSGDSIINESIPQRRFNYNEDDILEALAKKIECPDLSDREKYLLSLSESANSPFTVIDIKSKFSDETIKRCPFCYQEIKGDYREEYLESIKRILNKDREDHIKELEASKKNLEGILTFVNILNLNRIENISKLGSYTSVSSLAEQAKLYLNEIIAKITEKENNVYSPIVFAPSALPQILLDLTEALVKLEDERKAYNENASKTDEIVAKLKELNNQIGYYEVKPSDDAYRTALNAKSIADGELARLKKSTNDIKIEISKLEEKKKKVDIAADEINKYLSFILGSRDRLTIQYYEKEEVYMLKSRGQSIKTKQASVGERNIIALSYFFASILQNKNKKDAYKNDYLIVIDDPISSFDAANRVGIMSFLKYMMDLFVGENKNTRMLVSTHDIKTAFDINVIYREIKNQKSGKWYYHKLELRNKEIIPFEEKRNEYAELLRITYGYACSEDKSEMYDIVIGNIMRQVLEAYATFNYGIGMSEMTTNNGVLSCIIHPELKSYFKDRMYRLFLNEGSHTEESARSLDDGLFFSYLSDDDKRKVAQDVICFLYELNSLHVLKYLRKGDEKEMIIQGWIEERIKLKI